MPSTTSFFFEKTLTAFIILEVVGVNSYPNLVANLPVKRDALEGEQTGLDEYPFVHKTLQIGKVVTCVVTDVKHDRVCIEIGNCVLSHVKRFDLSREKSEQRTDRFTIGDKIDAKIISISEIKDENASRRIALSIKEMEEDSCFGS